MKIEALVSRAKAAQAAGDPWHFHLLFPGCKLNNSKDHVFVLELAGETLESRSAEPQTAAGEELVQLQFGKKILRPPAAPTANPAVAAMLQEIGELGAGNLRAWHHHVLLPGCAFNPHPGTWTVLFEGKTVREAVFDEEPREELARLETVYYGKN
ncbi:MAG: hypothetical protein KKA90_04055 [Nanoarchaeota archaeon]|nr:hypothetical protein [Nanoarchaeota archaeon]